MKILRGLSKMFFVRQHLLRKRLPIFVAILVGFVGLGLTPALAVDERVIDVVSVNWPGSAPSSATVDEIAATVDTDVNARWKAYTTQVGAPTDRTISFKSGQILAAPITLQTRMPCTGSGATDFIGSMRIETYKRLGISDYSSRYLIIAVPKAGCVWSGRAPMGGPKSVSGSLVLHDSGSAFVIAHELGHTFGLGHSNFLRCDSNKLDGPWGDDCKAVEYGGVIDVMGNVDTNSTLNTYHQWRMGYLEDSQVKQVWQSETLTLSPSDFATGLKAIYIRDGNAAYWIEYRRANPDLLYKAGLVVFRLDPPPISSVVSPNPEDAAASEFGDGLGTDVWMLNMDNYRYVLSRASGSMSATKASLYSKNISLTATTSDTGAVVSITKKVDNTPPPTPVLVDPKDWKFPTLSIIKSGYEDIDTAVTSFQISIDGVISDLPGSPVQGWNPTYLNPFVTPVTVLVRDLPEGSYLFALRTIDRAGNQSAWSSQVKAVIDRGRPNVSNDFQVTSANTQELTLAWTGASDKGSGLCATNVVNSLGFITQSSNNKTAPSITVTNGQSIKATAQVFDCVGNGITGDFEASASFIPADKSSRTGRWEPAAASNGAGSLKCIGKCSASLTVYGDVSILIGTGAAQASIASKIITTIADSKAAKIRISPAIKVGPAKKVIRVSGTNFVFAGVAGYSTAFTQTADIARNEPAYDSSLSEATQLSLSRFGFNSSDFSQEWTVLPMNNGTTLLDPSLDLCGATYASEKDRTERRQMIVNKKTSPYIFLSTEVVRYSSKLAAEQAQKELQTALAKCKIDAGFTNITGTYTPYSFGEINNLPSELMPSGQRTLVRTQINTAQKAQQLLAFYQFNGAVLSGLYIIKSGETGFAETEVAAWLKVAATMATRLKK